MPLARLLARRLEAARPRTRLATVAAAAAAIAAAAAVAPASASAAQLAGVQEHLLWGSVDTAQVESRLDLAKAGGADIVRVDLGWSSLEPVAKGQYDAWYLGKIDTVVDRAAARNIKLLFTVTTTPCWASSAPDTVKQNCTGAWWSRGVQNYAPSNPADYAAALAYLVRRYGQSVAAWEVWNEPNSDDFFNSPDNASQYAAVLKVAYPAAKAASPQAKILGGSLMHADAAFTDALYAKGIKGSFDAWSIHPYSDDRSPLDPGSDAWIKASFLRGVPAVRDVMLRYGDDKPMWLTEFGWSTCTVRNSSNWLNGVSESTQATYVADAYAQMKTWSYVEAGFYFRLRDMSSDATSTLDNFGLVRFDGSQKPAFQAFKAASAALKATTTPPPTTTPTTPTPTTPPPTTTPTTPTPTTPPPTTTPTTTPTPTPTPTTTTPTTSTRKKRKSAVVRMSSTRTSGRSARAATSRAAARRAKAARRS